MRAQLVFFPDARLCDFKLSTAVLVGPTPAAPVRTKRKGWDKKKKRDDGNEKDLNRGKRRLGKPQGEENSFLVFKCATTLQSVPLPGCISTRHKHYFRMNTYLHIVYV